MPHIILTKLPFMCYSALENMDLATYDQYTSLTYK